MPRNAPHAPSAAAVKIAYVQALTDAYKPMDDAESSEMRREFAAEFDRFLAAHDAQVARNTLDELIEYAEQGMRIGWADGDRKRVERDRAAVEVTCDYMAIAYPEEPLDA